MAATTVKTFTLDYAPGVTSHISVAIRETPKKICYMMHYNVTRKEDEEEYFSGSHNRTLFYQGSEIWNDSAKSDMLVSLIDDLRASCKACKYNSGETMKAVRCVIDAFRAL